jgi:hypothetical protein
MKVFLGWSGDTSQKVALALSDWLPKVIQAVKPFVSSEDIAKGARWSLVLAKELQASSFGIICITKENSESAWINFEAGALSREIETSLVTPFLFNLREAEIQGPLKQFQVVTNEKSEILKLVTSINNKLGENLLEEANLKAAFEMWWSELNKKLDGIQQEVGKTPARQTRTTPEMVEELLELARMQQRDLANALQLNNDRTEARFATQMVNLQQVGTTLSALTRSVESLYAALKPIQPPSFATAADLKNLSPDSSARAGSGAVWGSPPPPPPASLGWTPAPTSPIPPTSPIATELKPIPTTKK